MAYRVGVLILGGGVMGIDPGMGQGFSGIGFSIGSRRFLFETADWPMKRRLAENWKRIEQRIAEACGRVQRYPSEVTVVAVTKYATIDVIRSLVEMGVRDVGESRVQNLCKRAEMINKWLWGKSSDGSAETAEAGGPAPRWHMIGHLQRNKVKQVLPWVEMIHSIDSLRLAEELDSRAAAIDRVIPCFLEVNASADPGKHGVAVAATTHLAEQVHTLKHIELRGLMTMAPLTDDVERIRTVFRRVRELFDEIVSDRICNTGFTELSMGMSNDFELAIETGATYVRIGSALFEGIDLPSPSESENVSFPSSA